jgi:hypothetical protein
MGNKRGPIEGFAHKVIIADYVRPVRYIPSEYELNKE